MLRQFDSHYNNAHFNKTLPRYSAFIHRISVRFYGIDQSDSLNLTEIQFTNALDLGKVLWNGRYYNVCLQKGFWILQISCLWNYTLSIYPSVHKQLIRGIPNPFRGTHCIWGRRPQRIYVGSFLFLFKFVLLLLLYYCILTVYSIHGKISCIRW